MLSALSRVHFLRSATAHCDKQQQHNDCDARLLTTWRRCATGLGVAATMRRLRLYVEADAVAGRLFLSPHELTRWMRATSRSAPSPLRLTRVLGIASAVCFHHNSVLRPTVSWATQPEQHSSSWRHVQFTCQAAEAPAADTELSERCRWSAMLCDTMCVPCRRAENNSRKPKAAAAEWEAGRLLRTPIGHQVG